MSELEPRIDRLEKLWEHDHNTIELLAIYIPRLTDILIKYWIASGRHRKELMDAVKIIDNDLQEHFKIRTDKKRKSKYKEYE